MGKDYPNEFFCSLEILRESGIENRYIGISESELSLKNVYYFRINF